MFILDIGSESVQFDNASIYVQFGLTSIMFFGIFFIYFYPSGIFYYPQGYCIKIMITSKLKCDFQSHQRIISSH